MSFAASWYRASCALLLLTCYFSMFSFYPPFLLSLSLPPSFSLSMSLCGCKTRVIWCPLPSILFLIDLSFHTLSLHSSYKIHQPFTDYLLRLPSSELLEKHIFRSRANRRLVFQKGVWDKKRTRVATIALLLHITITHTKLMYSLFPKKI